MSAIDLTRFELDGRLPAGLHYLRDTDILLKYDPLDFDQRDNLRQQMAGLNAGADLHPIPGGVTHLEDRSGFRLPLDAEWALSGGTLLIKNCSDFELDFNGMLGGDLVVGSREKFFIELHGCHRFRLKNLQLDGGRNQLMIEDCDTFLIEHCRFAQAEGYGMTVLNCHNFVVSNCQFEDCLASGLMVLGHCHAGVIEFCGFRHSRGDYNWDAALHLCAVSERVTSEDVPEHCHENLPLANKNRRPHHIVVQDSLFTDSRAQGIYLEGAVNCLLQRNLIACNNKEGICFDWGSVANCFVDNEIVANGKRADMTESSISADFLQHYALLRDNSSALKLPGVSLDNAYLNLLRGNRVERNYGGGIKMVRAAQGNIIEDNRIVANVVGRNLHVPHSNGISMLSLGAMEEFDADSESLLDFLPSALNQIRNNVVSGHSAEIFQDASCYGNDVLELTRVEASDQDGAG